jgi:hypothetical protein
VSGHAIVLPPMLSRVFLSNQQERQDMKTFFCLALASLCALAASSALAQSRLPAQISIDNQRPANLTELVISDAEGNAVARLARPLAPGKKSALKLGKAKGCEMNVQARFEDDSEVDETLDLCKEKVLRFRE